MSNQKSSAYGTPASDTDFRKKWDLDEYAAKADARESAEREERKARYEAKLAGKKYYKPSTGDETHTTARNATIDLSSMVGKQMLVPAGAGVGKRGRGAGFYCEACDLTFKDNLQLIEHQNSMQHLRNTGQNSTVRKASAEEVHARIELLWERLQERKRQEVITLAERLEVRREEEEKESEERRKKRREDAERRKVKKEEEVAARTDYGEDLRIEGEHEQDDMMAQFGFTAFGTSKK
jgi:U4/U6.U5 tri-snRNP component SNU23